MIKPGIRRQGEPFSGALIIITRNYYSKELFNGDIGMVLRDKSGSLQAVFQRNDADVGYPVSLLSSWDPGFAMTVHNSQGSEFDNVLLVLPDNENYRLLTPGDRIHRRDARQKSCDPLWQTIGF